MQSSRRTTFKWKLKVNRANLQLLICFVNCVKEGLNTQIMQINYVPKHYQDRADSEYVSYVG